jgi:hypothetical protein
LHPRVTDPRTHEWRCHSCRLLLGIAHGSELVVRYKDVELRIRGVCVHACRRCRAANSINVPQEVSPHA